jgi:hypothetical protein
MQYKLEVEILLQKLRPIIGSNQNYWLSCCIYTKWKTFKNYFQHKTMSVYA